MHKVTISPTIVELLKKRRGRYHLFPAICASETAMLVIDMQNVFCAEGGAFEVPMARAIVDNINLLAAECRKKGIPVIWIRSVCEHEKDWLFLVHYFLGDETRDRVFAQLKEGSWGTEFWPGLDIQPEDLVVRKFRYSPFIGGSSNLDCILRGLRINTLIITGTKTNVCCESTARDAMMLDYKVLFVSDGTATVTDEEHASSLNILAQSFCDVLSTQETIELIRNS